ncbi:tetratricopeptide (TPR) repeat protein [Bradyrhizobium sp. F1.13.4]
MASPFPKRGLARLRQILLQPFALALMGISLCGCSFDLGSLTPEKDKPQEAPKAATTAENVVSASNVSEAQAHTAKAQALAKSGDAAAALDEFNHAVGLDPYNAQALYGRALIYQGKNQHDFAIADFSAASGLNPRRRSSRCSAAPSAISPSARSRRPRRIWMRLPRPIPTMPRSGPYAGKPMNGWATGPRRRRPTPRRSRFVHATTPPAAALPASAADDPGAAQAPS